MPDAYERSIVVKASIERVWRAFTEPDELEVWHGRAELFEAVEGGRIRFIRPSKGPSSTSSRTGACAGGSTTIRA